MNEQSNSRWWRGPEDPVHPLSRTAHACVSYGRYIYVLNGYGSTDDEMCLFDRVGLTRFDPLSNSVHFLPIHWDTSSLRSHGCNPLLLNTSGIAAAVQPGNDRSGPCIYAFAGFSLIEGFHTNCLVRYRLPQSHLLSESSGSELRGQLQTCCSFAAVIAGHGFFSYCCSLLPESTILETLVFTTLMSFQRRLSSREFWHKKTSRCAQPSPRDKSCMEYWRDRLYVFGGYGPKVRPPPCWPINLLQWPFLYSADNPDEWLLCENERGWNNQLLIYHIENRYWTLADATTVKGRTPSARAAHRSALDNDRGWMFIFGGRGPSLKSSHCRSEVGLDRYNAYECGRLNDLHCLNLQLMEWTRVLTPLDFPTIERPIWPCGRSWMGMALIDSGTIIDDISACVLDDLPSECSRKANSHLFISGGFSNSNVALSDVYVLGVSPCSRHDGLEARVLLSSDSSVSSDRFNSFVSPPPTVISGFTCSVETFCAPDNIVRFTRCNSEFQLDKQQCLPACVCTTQIPFVDNDVAYLVAAYSQKTLSPQVHGPSPLPKSTDSFFHISKTHADFITYLLCNFCVYNVCHHKSETLGERVTESQLGHQISLACSELASRMRPVYHTLCFFIRAFPRFMLPWDPIVMILRELGAWFPVDHHRILVEQLTSEYAACGDKTIMVSFSRQALMDKIALLLPVDKIHLPVPFDDHTVDMNRLLAYHIQHTILSFLLWSGKGPLNLSTNNISHLHRTTGAATFARVTPLPRFWHTVTFGLDEGVYVIGGSTLASSNQPVELFRLVQPMSLTNTCLHRISTQIRDHLLMAADVGKVLPKSLEPLCIRRCVGPTDVDRMTCNCSRCAQICQAINVSVERQLSTWLL